MPLTVNVASGTQYSRPLTLLKPLVTTLNNNIFCLHAHPLIFTDLFLIYARSLPTLTFLPRVTTLYFILFHVYFFNVVYGFFFLALIATALFMAHAVVHFIRKHEVPALHEGHIHINVPRSLSVELPFPAPISVLPPLTSLFHPFNVIAAGPDIESVDPQAGQSVSAPTIDSPTSGATEPLL